MTSKNCHERDLLFEEVFFTFSLLLLRLLSLDRDLGPPVLMMNKENTIFDWLNVLRYHHQINRFSFRCTSFGASFHEIGSNITSHRANSKLPAVKISPVLALLIPAPGSRPLLSVIPHSSEKPQNQVPQCIEPTKIVASEAKTMRRAVVQQQQRAPGTKLPQYFHWREDELETWEFSTFWQCKIIHY